MKQIKGTPAVLVAAEGKKLTQADDAVGLSERIVTERVYLAVNDSPDNWCDIPQEEAEQIIMQQQNIIDNINNL